jgi:2-polyprenyl-3-methyl-5-hydroxy-6-metoxy-1,4-benzoquinol methylase
MNAAVGRGGVDETRMGVDLRYACELARLGELAERFVPSQLDAEGEAFLAAALKRNHTRAGYWAHRALTLLMSDFDANALLGMYPVFLLSTPQAMRLFELAQPGGLHSARLLDIGAGSGDVTTRLAPLVEAVSCTETSRQAARRLRKRGFSCWLGQAGEGAPGDPLASEPPFDVITLSNVIDRAARPRSLLGNVVRHLPVGGLLLLSTPLPYAPFFYDGAVTRDPIERLNVSAESWEEACVELWRHELAPLGLSLQALTRLPYLSGGDVQYPAYVLDDAVLVCKKER